LKIFLNIFIIAFKLIILKGVKAIMDFRKVGYLDLEYELNDKTFRFSPFGSIVFGHGVVAEVGKHVKNYGGKKVLVCTDKGIVKVGLLEKVTDSLDAYGIEYTVFDDIEPNPSVETVYKAVELCKDCDMVIGFGGGSSIDTAKTSAMMVTNGGKIEQYEGIVEIKVPPLPIIAIPTTSGTGAEATPFAVVTDTTKDWKMALGSSYLIPSLAICDPDLTLTLPAGLTASTGMDALTHAIEGYTSLSNEPFSEALAAKAIKLISENLRAAVAKGEANKDARYGMMLGSTMAATSFTNTILGICHSMAHPLGGIFHIGHGYANAIMLPIVMEFNLIGNPEKFKDIAILMGEDVSGLSLMDAAAKAVEAVKKLSNDIGIPKLSKFGVTEADLPKLAEEAMKGGDRWTNPRDTNLEDFIEMYKKAL
jgi:alcohol dehydrogenase class IV